MSPSPPGHILVLNAGSSSLKFKLFHGDVELLAGHVDGIGKGGVSTLSKRDVTRSEAHHIDDHAAAVDYALAVMKHELHGEHDHAVTHVLHRVVHGGERFTHHAIIDDEIERGIEELCTLAPLHNPANLAGIRAARASLPRAVHLACFDTAFHHTIPRHAFLYGIPYTLYEKWGIRKYGFHGLSHQYISERVYDITHRSERLISCHLGAGSSIAAIHHGRSLDTTMGFTPLDGLLMSTRSGELDPEIPIFLLEHEHYTPQELTNLLNKESGMKGLVGTGDLREIKRLADNGNARAQLVIQMLVYRIAEAIGSYHIAVGGAHTIAFTGGIGEHADWVRAQVCRLLAPIGVQLDEQANAEGKQVISGPSSRVTVLVLPANEELHMVHLLQRGSFTRH